MDYVNHFKIIRKRNCGQLIKNLMEEYQVTEDESKLNGEKIKVLEPSKVLIVSIVVVLFREYPLNSSFLDLLELPK